MIKFEKMFDSNFDDLMKFVYTFYIHKKIPINFECLARRKWFWKAVFFLNLQCSFDKKNFIEKCNLNKRRIWSSENNY